MVSDACTLPRQVSRITSQAAPIATDLARYASLPKHLQIFPHIDLQIDLQKYMQICRQTCPMPSEKCRNICRSAVIHLPQNICNDASAAGNGTCGAAQLRSTSRLNCAPSSQQVNSKRLAETKPELKDQPRCIYTRVNLRQRQLMPHPKGHQGQLRQHPRGRQRQLKQHPNGPQ